MAAILLAACGSAQPPEPDYAPAPVAVMPPTVAAANVPQDPRVSIASQDDPVLPVLDGSWVEDFEGRAGCKDVIEMHQGPRGLSLSGVDCNDNEPYDFQSAEFDGRRLDVRVLVTSSRYILNYHLTLESASFLNGDVEVVGGGSKTRYSVSWRRRGHPEDEP